MILCNDHKAFHFNSIFNSTPCSHQRNQSAFNSSHNLMCVLGLLTALPHRIKKLTEIALDTLHKIKEKKTNLNQITKLMIERKDLETKRNQRPAKEPHKYKSTVVFGYLNLKTIKIIRSDSEITDNKSMDK